MKLKKLIKEIEEETEKQMKYHINEQGQCNSYCCVRNKYLGRIEVIEYLKNSLDKRKKKKNLAELND